MTWQSELCSRMREGRDVFCFITLVVRFCDGGEHDKRRGLKPRSLACY